MFLPLSPWLIFRRYRSGSPSPCSSGSWFHTVSLSNLDTKICQRLPTSDNPSVHGQSIWVRKCDIYSRTLGLTGKHQYSRLLFERWPDFYLPETAWSRHEARSYALEPCLHYVQRSSYSNRMAAGINRLYEETLFVSRTWRYSDMASSSQIRLPETGSQPWRPWSPDICCGRLRDG